MHLSASVSNYGLIVAWTNALLLLRILLCMCLLNALLVKMKLFRVWQFSAWYILGNPNIKKESKLVTPFEADFFFFHPCLPLVGWSWSPLWFCTVCWSFIWQCWLSGTSGWSCCWSKDVPEWHFLWPQDGQCFSLDGGVFYLVRSLVLCFLSKKGEIVLMWKILFSSLTAALR